MEANFKSILVHDGECVDLHLSHPLLKNKTTSEVTGVLLPEEVPPSLTYYSIVVLPVGLEAWTGSPQSHLQQTVARETKKRNKEKTSDKTAFRCIQIMLRPREPA